jgi:putative nucleotidyltransferase with HDIG domain
MSVSPDVLESLEAMKPLPQVAMRVISITADPDYDIKDLYQTVSLDRAVTASVLRLVNSTAYALRNPVSSLEHALKFMGARNLANMVLSVCAARLLHSQDGIPKEAKERSWRHSVAVAVASDELARIAKGVRRDLAFTAGLLHDLGRAAIPYEDLVKNGPPDDENGECWLNREMEVVGGNHDEIGGLLLTRWKLPEELQLAVSNHSSPSMLDEESDQARLACVLHLAEVRCSGMGLAAFEEGRESPLCPEAAKRLALSGEDLGKIWPRIIAQIEKADGLLNLQA